MILYPRLILLKYMSIGIFLFFVSGCSREAVQEKPIPAPAVGVYQVTTEKLGTYLEFVARTQAHQTAEIQARVEGELIERTFEEGSFVKKDQLLLRIDPSEYEATLAQTKADLSSHIAEAENAKRNLNRGLELSSKGYISQSDLDKLRTLASQSESAKKSAKASLKKAELNLEYTKIKAPFSGNIGKIYVDVGNIVGPQTGALASIAVIDTINVTFQLEDRLYLNYLQTHQNDSSPRNAPIDVTLRLPNNTVYSQAGVLNFADTKVDQSTGTVALRASFPNPDGIILPGLFVTLIAEGKEKQIYALIPQVAVQANLQGKFVLVLDESNKVSARVVKMGRRINAMWVVESGLAEGERILVDGLQKVRPGVKVTPMSKIVDKMTGTISAAPALK
ncbi:efflux RND transporter periplasmic adaptor subunit [bacterium AH-315-K03]|nr:efflux RND transporter periplasmic adaptor subunit [bacterium AH-315-K03]